MPYFATKAPEKKALTDGIFFLKMDFDLMTGNESKSRESNEC